jgi:hypothetical protein
MNEQRGRTSHRSFAWQRISPFKGWFGLCAGDRVLAALMLGGLAIRTAREQTDDRHHVVMAERPAARRVGIRLQAPSGPPRRHPQSAPATKLERSAVAAIEMTDADMPLSMHLTDRSQTRGGWGSTAPEAARSPPTRRDPRPVSQPYGGPT